MKRSVLFVSIVLLLSGLLLIVLAVGGAFKGVVAFPLHLLRLSTILTAAVSGTVFLRLFYLQRKGTAAAKWVTRLSVIVVALALFFMVGSAALYINQLEPNVSSDSKQALQKSGLYNK